MAKFDLICFLHSLIDSIVARSNEGENTRNDEAPENDDTLSNKMMTRHGRWPARWQLPGCDFGRRSQTSQENDLSNNKIGLAPISGASIRSIDKSERHFHFRDRSIGLVREPNKQPLRLVRMCVSCSA